MMSVVQNMTPLGGHRGRVWLRSGGEEVFETGTLRREWNRAKPLPWGPKGWKGAIWLSVAKTDEPSFVWVVTTRRGAGS
jgi:hypothetical protein